MFICPDCGAPLRACCTEPNCFHCDECLWCGVNPARTEWTAEWPEEEGFYLFRGYQWDADRRDAHIRTVVVEARLAGRESDHFWVYIASGAFMYRSEKHVGLWHKLSLPELPDDRLIEAARDAWIKARE